MMKHASFQGKEIVKYYEIDLHIRVGGSAYLNFENN